MSTKATTDDVKLVFGLRVANYALLARLFKKEVDGTLLVQLLELRLPAHTGSDDLDRGYRLLQGYLSRAWERTLSDLAKDYVRTFIGNSVDGFSAAYPSESVHTTGLRLVMQDSRDEVLAAYRLAGLDKSEDWHEGEDHIAVELEFMQIMAQRSVDAVQSESADELGELEGLLRTQLGFLENHLLNWVPMFVDEMHRFAKTDFYKALGYWLSGYLQTDQEFLKEALDIKE